VSPPPSTPCGTEPPTWEAGWAARTDGG